MLGRWDHNSCGSGLYLTEEFYFFKLLLTCATTPPWFSHLERVRPGVPPQRRAFLFFADHLSHSGIIRRLHAAEIIAARQSRCFPIQVMPARRDNAFEEGLYFSPRHAEDFNRSMLWSWYVVFQFENFHSPFQTQFRRDLRKSSNHLKTSNTRLARFANGDWEREEHCIKMAERETVILPFFAPVIVYYKIFLPWEVISEGVRTIQLWRSDLN